MEHGKVALGKALQLGWVEMKKKSDGTSDCCPKVKLLSEIEDIVNKDLQNLATSKGLADVLNNDKIKEYKKRKLIQEV